MPYREPFPIPENIYAETFCLCLEIPNDPTWKQVVSGLLYELNHWFNWQRDDAKSGKECAQVWRELYNQIDWSTMSCCCDQTPVRYRYTSEGVLQQSTDNGVTWTDAPDYDPRNYSPQFPPMSGEDGQDKKCLAATGAANLIKEQVADQLTDGMSRYTLDQLITDWVTTYIETSNPFAALLTVVTNQIFALVIATLRPALTSAVFETLKCILYCNIGDDATFNQGQWEAVRSDITDQIGGIAGVFLEHLVYLLGVVGLTNVARASGASSGDCAECPPCNPFCGSDWVKTDDRLADLVYDSENQTISGDATNLFGNYYFSANVPYPGCCTMYVQIDSGSIDFKFASPCDYTGSLSLDETVGWTAYPLGIPDAPFRGVLLRSPVPFHVTISLT